MSAWPVTMTIKGLEARSTSWTFSRSLLAQALSQTSHRALDFQLSNPSTFFMAKISKTLMQSTNSIKQ